MLQKAFVPASVQNWPGKDDKSTTLDHSLVTSDNQSFDWRKVKVGDIRRSISDHQRVIVWNGYNRRLLPAIESQTGNHGDHPGICLVTESDPLPKDLAAALGSGVSLLVRLPAANDLICIGSNLLAQASDADTLLTFVVRHANRTACVPAEINSATASETLPQVGPGHPAIASDQLSRAIHAALATDNPLTPHQKCLQAGLLLMFDLLEDSHSVSQFMEGRGTPRTADYWHGIMHRREPDAGNASYWFRRVGHHPAFDSLAQHLPAWMNCHHPPQDEIDLMHSLLNARGGWDPFAMIEISQTALRKPGQLHDRLVRRVQYFEMCNLLSNLWM